MTVKKKDGRRDVIPRWRRSGDIAAFADSASPRLVVPRKLTAGIERSSLDVLSDFSSSKRPLIWAEALSLALADRDFDDAAMIVNSRKKVDVDRFPLLAEVDETYIRGLRDAPHTRSPNYQSGGSAADDLRSARRAVRVYESNALAWLDLARAYAVSGDLDRAERAVWGALRFDHETRWVVRAAARFFIHREKGDVGLTVIERSPGHRSDPWLVSAHIAVSHAMKKTSPLMRKARKLFEDDNFRPKHVSELGMALATVEADSSLQPSRSVNRLAKRSLRDPTENAVAQAEWIESNWGKAFGAAEAARDVQNAFEARAMELQKNEDWENAAAETFNWLCDQPFSSRPAIEGSYIAATFLKNFDLAKRFAEVGYRANPKDPLVRNNYAVALAECENVVKARRVFGTLGDPQSSDFEETYRATEGLLRYREGKLESARECYEIARTVMEKQGNFRDALISVIYQAFEEEAQGNFEEAAKLIQRGEDYAKRFESRDLAGVLHSERVELEKLASDENRRL